MKVLIACEESQRVCQSFRDLGHEAFSCDILPTSGFHPEWHIQDDVLNHLSGWDMIIAFPPCTHLSCAGAPSFYRKQSLQSEAIDFFMRFVLAPCQLIAIENPIGIMSTYYRKPDQIIQPYFFGDPHRKATCLWLKGLPRLYPTSIVQPEIIYLSNGKTDTPWHLRSLSLPPDQRRFIRSKTFPGIARAMASQWSCCNTQLSFSLSV